MGKEWWNDEDTARNAADQYGMTPEQMAEMGMYPDGTPYDSGPDLDDEEFAKAVGSIPDSGVTQER